MNPSQKTLTKRQMNERLKNASEETGFAKAVVVALLRCPGIYQHLPKMHPSNLPEIHIELSKTKDGSVVMLQNGEIYHVAVGKDNWFKRIVRGLRKRIKAWLTKRKESKS